MSIGRPHHGMELSLRRAEQWSTLWPVWVLSLTLVSETSRVRIIKLWNFPCKNEPNREMEYFNEDGVSQSSLRHRSGTREDTIAIRSRVPGQVSVFGRSNPRGMSNLRSKLSPSWTMRQLVNRTTKKKNNQRKRTIERIISFYPKWNKKSNAGFHIWTKETLNIVSTWNII